MHFLAALFIVAGFGMLLGAKSAIHEIEAFIIWLIAAVLACSASIRNAIEQLSKDLVHKEPEDRQLFFDSTPPSPTTRVPNWFFIMLIGLLLFVAITLLLAKDKFSVVFRDWLTPAEQHVK